MVFQLTRDLIFPNPDYAEEDGLLAIGGDLSLERLLLAYSNGIFPWPAEGYPLLWWSPNPRLVLFLNNFKLSKSLKKTIEKQKFEIKIDTDFEQIIQNCSNAKRMGQDGTWITLDIVNAYIKMYYEGFAHCIGAYYDGRLVGGLYGISLGSAFFGESMFHLESDASKVAFYYLVKIAKLFNFHYIDAQTTTTHLLSLGAQEIERTDFLKLLDESNENATYRGNWNQFIKPNFLKEL